MRRVLAALLILAGLTCGVAAGEDDHASVRGRTEVLHLPAGRIALTWKKSGTDATGRARSRPDGTFDIRLPGPGRYVLEGSGIWRGKPVSGTTLFTVEAGAVRRRDLPLEGNLGSDILSNGGFEEVAGDVPRAWEAHSQAGCFEATLRADGEGAFRGGAAARIEISRRGDGPWQAWQAGLSRTGIALERGVDYVFTFAARADRPRRIAVSLVEDGGDWNWYGGGVFTLGTSWQSFATLFTCTAEDRAARVKFDLGDDRPARADQPVSDDHSARAGHPPRNGADDREPWRTCTIRIDAVSLRPFPFRGETASVRVNQLGYAPDDPKRACFTGEAERFALVDARSGLTVFSGACGVPATDVTSGDSVTCADFSAFRKPGAYRVTVEEVGSSPLFTIGENVYRPALDAALKAFYYQRCGVALDPRRCGTALWGHAACHTAEASFHPSSGFAGTRDVSGGWHDAGDYGRYAAPGAVAAAALMRAFERQPALFDDERLDIPESGNGVPDILDEARFELAWLLTMQDPASGGVFHKVCTERTPSTCMPENDPLPQYIFGISSAATGDFAAALAQAGRVYVPFDREFASRCTAAAEKAYAFLEAHPTIQPAPGGFRNPPGVTQGGYGDSDDSDERLWAAVELLLTTGRKKYLDYVEQYLGLWWGGSYSPWSSWQIVGNFARDQFVRHGPPGKVRDEAAAGQAHHALRLAQAARTGGYGAALAPEGFIWGSNMLVLEAGTSLMEAYERTGDPTFRTAALDQLHYILGVNTHALSFLSGCGSCFPMTQYHMPSMADGALAGVPGFLSGGPDRHLSDPVLPALLDAATPPARCYVDRSCSFASNEVAVYWNASLVLLIASLEGEQRAPMSTVVRFDPFPPLIGCRQDVFNRLAACLAGGVLRQDLPRDERKALRLEIAASMEDGFDALPVLINGFAGLDLLDSRDLVVAHELAGLWNRYTGAGFADVTIRTASSGPSLQENLDGNREAIAALVAAWRKKEYDEVAQKEFLRKIRIAREREARIRSSR